MVKEDLEEIVVLTKTNPLILSFVTIGKNEQLLLATSIFQ